MNNLIDRPVLYVFSGLPGVGKTTIARQLALETEAFFLRIDTIENGLKNSHSDMSDLADAGYCAAYGLAEDNLRLGRSVIGDSVNPVKLTRDAWQSVASKTDARLCEIEVICSDITEHRRRVEHRHATDRSEYQPVWEDVLNREYEAWNRNVLRLDSASHTLEQCVQMILDAENL